MGVNTVHPLAVPDIFGIADILDRRNVYVCFAGVLHPRKGVLTLLTVACDQWLEINRSFIISKMVRVFWGGLLDGLDNR